MRTIAIGSGKGGVGKSSLTANLSIILARQGHRVVAMDADFGLANLDVILGMARGPTIYDAIKGTMSIEEVLRAHPCGLRVLAGCSGVGELADLNSKNLDGLLQGLHHLEVSTDLLLVDVAAGVHEAAIAMLAAADESIIVLNDDPASFVDAYATIKRLSVFDPDSQIRIVVNEVEDASRGKLLFARMRAVVREHMDVSIQYAGSIRRDDAMAEALRERAIVIERSPESNVAVDLFELADSLAPGGLRIERTRSSFFSRLFSIGRRSLRAA